MRKVKSLLNKMSSPMRPPAGLGDLRLTKSFVSKVFSLFITTQSAEDSRQRRSGMTALLDVKAFTLVELLVVVLIIGILSAVAIPMYQGAVDKSHWSTMLPGAKALKDAEEAIRMSNGLYTSNMDNLDVRMPNGDVQYTLETVNDDGTANVVRAINSKLGDKVRLSNYLDENTFFGGQLHCEAKDNDEKATRLCEKLLGGQELNTVGGYTRYLLDQSIDQATCGAAEKSWSTSKTTCYKDHQSRCEALDADYLGDGQCGYKNKGGKEIGEEKVCLGDTGLWACSNSIVSNGGVCIATGADQYAACSNSQVQAGGTCDSREESPGSQGCGGADIYEGGTCTRANIYQGGICQGGCYQVKVKGGICVGTKAGDCASASFSNGGICYALTDKACRVENNHYDWDVSGLYDSTSCCCGACHSSAPTCASRGKTCDPYYMDPNNFK